MFKITRHSLALKAAYLSEKLLHKALSAAIKETIRKDAIILKELEDTLASAEYLRQSADRLHLRVGSMLKEAESMEEAANIKYDAECRGNTACLNALENRLDDLTANK